jgi:hypothetical protein
MARWTPFTARVERTGDVWADVKRLLDTADRFAEHQGIRNLKLDTEQIYGCPEFTLTGQMRRLDAVDELEEVLCSE